MEGVFYAVVVVEAAGGVVEVDARPSDALNLAVVTRAPVRVDAAVLSNPDVDCHPEWEQCPARWRDLARADDPAAGLAAGESAFAEFLDRLLGGA